MSASKPKAAPAKPAAPKLVLKSKVQKASPTAHFHLPFGRKNFIHMFIGIGILTLGYLLMNDKEYKGAETFSMALHVAPLIVLSGYAYLVYAILLKDKNIASKHPHSSSEQ